MFSKNDDQVLSNARSGQGGHGRAIYQPNKGVDEDEGERWYRSKVKFTRSAEKSDKRGWGSGKRGPRSVRHPSGEFAKVLTG
jgi:hypothetical protein